MMLKIVRLWECSRAERGKLLKRSELDVSSVMLKATKIVADVRDQGDKALLKYTKKLDGVKLDRKQLPAIAAMAYGTTTIPKVDKIVGPGNIYVVAAKQVVAPNVDVDFAAGPSEDLIIADASTNPTYIAADMLAQAEHDPAAAAVLVTTSLQLASRVCKSLEKMFEESPRAEIARRALSKYGRAIVATNLQQSIECSNDYAPEHLELMIKRPKQILKRIRNAGAIFIGPYSPVAAGDFAVGPNHILPTGSAALRHSGLSVLDFVRLPTVQELTKRGLRRVAAVAERLAEVEGLPGHAQSIKKRLKEG